MGAVSLMGFPLLVAHFGMLHSGTYNKLEPYNAEVCGLRVNKFRG